MRTKHCNEERVKGFPKCLPCPTCGSPIYCKTCKSRINKLIIPIMRTKAILSPKGEEELKKSQENK